MRRQSFFCGVKVVEKLSLKFDFQAVQKKWSQITAL